jgi:nucleotide-binding universal stress UspA family protein
MPGILIITDFSDKSKHALDFACTLLKDKAASIDLLHIYQLPGTYSADGIAVAAMGNALEQADTEVEEEAQRAKNAYPGLEITGRIVVGGFLETLREETQNTKPAFLILGTAGFNDFYLGDEDPLNALRTLQVPVLFVPHGAAIKPIKHVAYACNYAYAGPQTPVNEITQWINFMHADLEIVHSDPNPEGTDEVQVKGKGWLKTALNSLQPVFNWVQDSDMLRGLSSFFRRKEVDCVLVVPRKYGFWQTMFRNSRTKALIRLNKLPVIAFHVREV